MEIVTAFRATHLNMFINTTMMAFTLMFKITQVELLCAHYTYSWYIVVLLSVRNKKVGTYNMYYV